MTYLIGSINFAILVLRLLGKQDPRTQFSGNAGATNVYRQAGWGWAAVVLLLDMGRAVAIALLALGVLPPTLVPWIGFALVVGNRYPCFHGLRGGKGVANYLGFTLPLSPFAAALSCLIWVVVYRIVRIPFIASFFMILILGAGMAAASGGGAAPLAGTLATVLLILFNHKRNIRNYLAETR